jgi:hypothetical protein
MRLGKTKGDHNPKTSLYNRSHVKEILKVHGVSYGHFLKRLYSGWNECRAATQPLRNSKELRNHGIWAEQIMALINTCGMSIEDDLYKELEYMFLLGAPRLTREKTTIVITEREIVDIIIRKHNIKNYLSYKGRLSSDRRPDYKELLINMVFNNEESHTFYAATYLSDHDKVKGNGMISYSHWMSKEKGIGYLYYVTFDK